MKGRLFMVDTFSSENEMLDFINNDDFKEPVAVILLKDHTYKLYYLW